MGLFDKRDKRKKQDDFDSPVEQIDLSAAPAPEPAAPPAPDPVAALSEPEAAPPMSAMPRRAPVREPDPYDDYEPPEYGIDKAIELMRTLPTDNVELVVQVVKHTLESTRIKITHIIEDATRKQDDITGRIKVLREEIDEFEKEIATRREEIGRLEADFSETSTVKERLLLAEQLEKKSGPTAAPSGQASAAHASAAHASAAQASAAQASAAQAGKPAISSGGQDRANASGTIGGPRPHRSTGPLAASPGGSSGAPAAAPKPKTTIVAKK